MGGLLLRRAHRRTVPCLRLCAGRAGKLVHMGQHEGGTRDADAAHRLSAACRKGACGDARRVWQMVQKAFSAHSRHRRHHRERRARRGQQDRLVRQPLLPCQPAVGKGTLQIPRHTSLRRAFQVGISRHSGHGRPFSVLHAALRRRLHVEQGRGQSRTVTCQDRQ